MSSPDAVLAEAAKVFGTPCYVTDLRTLDARALELMEAFPDPWLRQYSLKANPLPAIVGRLRGSGLGANVVSSGEWAAAKAAGLPNAEVTFEGIGKTDAELEAVVTATAQGQPLRWVTLESLDEERELAALADSSGLSVPGTPVDVLLRLNPGVVGETRADFQVGAPASKFGMSTDELLRCADEMAARGGGLRLRGVHVHVGSQLAATDSWVRAATLACELLSVLGQRHSAADTVDLGGGFPAGELSSPRPAAFRDALEAEIAACGVKPPGRTAIEPGRYLVADAGWLLTRVLHVREREKPQVIIDASMAELIRPSLYGARHLVLALGADTSGSRPTLVEGAVCESTDSFGVHDLPPLRRGDLLGFANTGAYVASMFSHYNGRPRPPEVLISPGGELELARPGTDFAP